MLWYYIQTDLLLDEPLSAVDDLTRATLSQAEINTVCQKAKFTCDTCNATQCFRSSLFEKTGSLLRSPRPGHMIHMVDVPFKTRDQTLRSNPKFTKIVNEIPGKLTNPEITAAI